MIDTHQQSDSTIFIAQAGLGGDTVFHQHMSNVNHTPVIEELVALASKHTGLAASYRLGGQTYGEMDWCDAAEAWDNGYTPDPGIGAIFTNTSPTTDMGPFWKELERLEALIKAPLDEPILSDDHPVFQGLLYVVNGKPKMFIDGENMTVGRWKALRIKDVKPVHEVRRCDIIGRQLRRPEKDVDDTSMMDTWGSANNAGKKKYRRSRSSNKIKKVS